MNSNILFITIDSLRADKFFSNLKSSFTPNIDKLIKNGTYFSQAISCAPETLPSLAAIFTSIYPSSSLVSDKNLRTMNPKLKNHLQILKENNYQIFTSHHRLTHKMQLDEIIDNVESFRYSSLTHDGLGNRIIQKLKSDMKKPWFYYVHVMDLHEAESQSIKESTLSGFSESKYGKNVYEKLISSLDTWIGKIIQHIDFENTVLVILADHGTERGNMDETIFSFNSSHSSPSILSKISKKTPNFLKKKISKKYLEIKNEKKHEQKLELLKKISTSNLSIYQKRLFSNSISSTANIFDDICKIPLLFVGKNIPKNLIIQEQVSSLDIFPTLEELLDIPNVLLNQGKSLLPLLQKQKFTSEPILLDCLTNSLKGNSQNTIGIRTSQYKYFRDRDDSTKNITLFDLKNDPLEEKNIAENNMNIIKNFENNILTLRNFSSKIHDEEIFTDEEAEEIESELRRQGYIN